MTELTKLEVGKTYVFKDDESKQQYINQYYRNVDLISKHYKDGFTIDCLDEDGDGLISGSSLCVIVCREIKFFKLKEENVMTNKFDKSMLKDGMVVVTREGEKYLVLGDKLLRNGGHNELGVYSDDMRVFDHSGDFDIVEVHEFVSAISLDINHWKLSLLWKREEKTPTQLKIEEMESSVAELQKQINELKQM